MKYSLCIETVFEDIPFYDRVGLAKDLGLDAIEFYNPAMYDGKKLSGVLANYNMPVAICGLNDGWTVRLNTPFDSLRENIEKTIRFGKEIGCTTFTGHVCEGELDREKEKLFLIENLKRIAELCEKDGVTIAIELLNSIYDNKGYLLDNSNIGFEVIKAVGSPSVKILYDCYHTQIMEGNLINTMRSNIENIAHFHGASVPNRCELFDGEINYRSFVETADKAGYDRYFGLEYWPTYDNTQSLQDVLKNLKGC
ncbi:hydroxypyruvate isomerase [Clostridia bacterium]|nr:hydroxypyruvate isomerase [Clostridia bacterium]